MAFHERTIAVRCETRETETLPVTSFSRFQFKYFWGTFTRTYPVEEAMNQFPWTDSEVAAHVQKAVRHYWQGRGAQSGTQQASGRIDAGSRGEVTGGKHLDAFVQLFCELIYAAGFRDDEVRFKQGVELPGYYRPTKKWDVVVVRKGRLCAAIELKSQVGSFGNNFNNRTEEALGNSEDLWTAFREKLLGIKRPWLGYFFFLEDTLKSTTPVKVAPTPFRHDPIFNGTSYAERYAILGRRLVLERKYDSTAVIFASKSKPGAFREATDLDVTSFLRSLYGHLIGCI